MEGEPINITFRECKIIDVRSFSYMQNNGGPVHYTPTNIGEGCVTKLNKLICNQKNRALNSLTYLPVVDCDGARGRYAPHIKIYEAKPSEEENLEIKVSPNTPIIQKTGTGDTHIPQGNKSIEINKIDRPDQNGPKNWGVILTIIFILVIIIVVIIAKIKGKPIGESIREIIKNKIGVGIPKGKTKK